MKTTRAILILLAAAAWLAPATASADHGALHFLDVNVESESDSPRICFTFDQKLAGRGDVRYEDYLRFDTDFDAAITATANRLCVEGVEHGETYAVTLLKGLPAARGLRLTDTEQFSVSVPDRAPSLSFRANAFILPRHGDRQLPLDSVNVTEAELRILRINDRNLIAEIVEGRISSLLGRWQTSRIEEKAGELIWQGKIEIDMKKNRMVRVAVPIGEILGETEPGIYVVMAVPKEKAKGYRYYEATQWMVVSDIGISSFSGGGGMHVFLRSLQDARPMSGLKVQLIARNNEVLGSATTDAEGLAVFAPGLLRGKGGARPGAVMATSVAGDFNFLDLTRPSFDLTDRGVGGRAAPGPIDAYLYSDRGVYRPGETVNLIALMRDDRAVALAGAPMILKLYRPDGTLHDTIAFNEGDKGGAYHLALPLAPSARTGLWTAQAHVDADAPPVGRVAFQVEDFVPERMEVALEAAAPTLIPGTANEIDVTARFLYGAPGAGLAVDSEIVLQWDRNPYPELKGYKFGLAQEEWRPRREELPPARTDEEGRVSLAVLIDEAPDTTLAVRAMVRVSVNEEGGRAVSRTIRLPVRSTPRMIGIKPGFGDSPVENDQEAGFKILTVDASGAPAATAGLVYELFAETYRYNWYYRNDRWGYKVLIKERSEKSGRLDIAASEPASLRFNLGWGRYRLEIHDPASGAATSVRFRVGWYSSSAGADVPDKLEIGLEKASYRSGETARVHIRPPFAGSLLLTVAGSRIYETRNLYVPREGMVVELPVSDHWDAGAYITATVFRAAEAGAAHRPSRAIGVAWLARDFSDRTLDVAIDAPERITPRQTIEVGISIAGVEPGAEAFVTLAAVDVGILQLTNYKTPSPGDWYYGKRRLGVELRDEYGRLIEAAEGGPVRYRQGGDEAGDRNLGGLDASSIKTVSLFSGIVRVDAGGRVTIPLDVPDFNGRLRLMAVAWSAQKVGSAETPLTVRDPVVSLVTLPRFLAPGDESRLSVALHNVDGPAGRYSIAMAAQGAVSIGGENADSMELASDQRTSLTFTLNGDTVGVGAVTLTIEGPDGLRLVRDWEIAVRPAQAVVTRRITRRIQPGESSRITGDILAGFVPGTGEAMITLGNRPEMDLPNLLASLDRYPYGCIEQTTSRALPLLYVGEVAKSLGIVENDAALRNKVQRAISRIFTMQRSDGSFGLWNPRSDREEWLTAYVMDFLTQAKELKYAVPDYAYQRALKWLARSVAVTKYKRSALASRAYALYVLARAGKVKMSDLRYTHDVYLNSIPTALGRAQLGAALALGGDKRRAKSAFAAARGNWDRPRRFWKDWRFWDYGSNLRDMAGTVYLASYTGQSDGDWLEIAQTLADTAYRKRYLSTQEKAWLVLAAQQLGGSGPVSISLDGRNLPEQSKPLYLRADAARLAGGMEIGNRGDAPLWQGVTVSGVPRQRQPAERKSGFVIQRAFYTLDGKRVNLGRVRQGDTLVAVISGEATTSIDHQALVVDLLPAGFELENSALEGGRDTGETGWLPELSKTRHVELRDDRYVAALDINSNGERSFTLAYVVRAVSPGKFTLPAIYVEDMYKPNYFGRTAMATVTIQPAN